MVALRSALAALAAGQGLSTAESHSAFASLLDGEAPDSVAAAFLTALKMKGETPFELEGAVRAVRERMTPWESGMDPGSLVDTCGTGATPRARSISPPGPRLSWRPAACRS